MATSDGPRWLSDDEQCTWLALTSVVMYLPAALDAQLRRDAGIGHFDYVAMSALSMSPGHAMRMSDLAGMTDASLSRLSHTFTRLEKKGWVTRAPDPVDGRFTLATLTDAGWAKVVDSAPGHVAAAREFVIDRLSPTEATLLRTICDRIVTAVAPPERDPAGPPRGRRPARPPAGACGDDAGAAGV
ncbi:MarR family winged helix-turn-helix transcriptional regulator [Gordonia sp. NPDC003376]